jgi:hypothetical protein
MAKKLGDLPTMKIGVDELARFAREADQRARESEAAESGRATRRPPSPTYADIEISVEVEDVALGDLEGALGNESVRPGAPFAAEQAPVDPGPPSGLELVGDDGPEPASIPFVVASREDLSWFALEEPSNIVLGMIDGESSVDSIAAALTLPREQTLAILRELRTHGVIDFL